MLASWLLLFAHLPAQATEVGSAGHAFGLGLALGDPPAGITGKYYLGGGQAIDGAIAWWNYGNAGNSFYLHGDYLWHPNMLADPGAFELWWHVGIGGLMWSNQHFWYARPWGDDVFGRDAVAVRAPIGLDMDFHDVRLEVFGEIHGDLYIVPGVGFDLGLTVGARYFF